MEQQNMDFNVSEATRFLEHYKKKKAIAKAGFLEELIKTNNNFNGKSIFDKKLLLENYYSKKAIDLVLADLGYTLDYSSEQKHYDCFRNPQGKTSIIVISKK